MSFLKVIVATQERERETHEQEGTKTGPYTALSKYHGLRVIHRKRIRWLYGKPDLLDNKIKRLTWSKKHAYLMKKIDKIFVCNNTDVHCHELLSIIRERQLTMVVRHPRKNSSTTTYSSLDNNDISSFFCPSSRRLKMRQTMSHERIP